MAEQPDPEQVRLILPPREELIAGVNEFELVPGISTRFGYCPLCDYVYPPADSHECADTD
jgi:hypothetical protein